MMRKDTLAVLPEPAEGSNTKANSLSTFSREGGEGLCSLMPAGRSFLKGLTMISVALGITASK
jgi:hypothetical protein